MNLKSIFSGKKIDSKKNNYIFTSVFVLITLLLGNIYVSSLVSPPIKPNKDVAELQSTPKTDTLKTFTPVMGVINNAPINKELVRVLRVIDGDTFEIDGGQRVRYIGIDTPELSGKVECYGREAYEKNRELIEGKEIQMVKDISETDRYGRLLRYVYIGDNFINDMLVRTGYANASSYPPDIMYQNQFNSAEREAREGGRGLWSSCSIQTTSVVKPTNTTKGTSTQSSGESYSCNCSKTCSEINSCAEAQYQLSICGCLQRDGNGDGIACEGTPLHCQN